MNKYRARRTEVDGITFASAKEARRYTELKLLQRAGKIDGLRLQPKYPLHINGEAVLIRSEGYPNGRQASAILDFEYLDRETGKMVSEDVKGMDNALSRLKRALVEAIYGVRVQVL